FHIDKTYAENGPYEGLIASGLHNLVLAHRMMLDGQIIPESSMGASGMDELRWLKPVRPGDTLKVSSEVLEKRPSKSRQDRGRLRMLLEVKNQHQEVVMTFTVAYMVARRPAGESSEK
ncbi:MAG: acyl dehydratase, partial [SAR324 cluster bacterium]|nr:acyl dehydratase [SAR324 cluster bacterium]